MSTTHPKTTPAAPRKARRLSAPEMSEAAFQRQVIQMARLFRWRVAHFRPARRQSGGFSTPVAADGKGFPDLVLVNRDTGELIAAELKRNSGRLTPEQEEWRADMLKGGSARHVVWRPRDFEDVRARLSKHAERTTV